MRFFNTSKLSDRKAEKKPTITVCSYNLGTGFEERHMLIPVAEARRRPTVRYRPLATPDEEIVVARQSPLEELAAWAAAEAARASPQCQPPPPRPSLISAFSSDVDGEEDLGTLYSPWSSTSELPVVIKDRELGSPNSMKLDRWFASRSPTVLANSARANLLPLDVANKRPDVKYRRL